MATSGKSPVKGGEEYLNGRKAGVEGPSGIDRSGTAHKTVISNQERSSSGSMQEDLTSAAKSLYTRAVADAPDPSKRGDQALRDR